MYMEIFKSKNKKERRYLRISYKGEGLEATVAKLGNLFYSDSKKRRPTEFAILRFWAPPPIWLT